jgi:hypothetical protein
MLRDDDRMPGDQRRQRTPALILARAGPAVRHDRHAGRRRERHVIGRRQRHRLPRAEHARQVPVADAGSSHALADGVGSDQK